MNPSDFKVTQLKAALQQLGFSTSGTKVELIARLQEADPSGGWMATLIAAELGEAYQSQVEDIGPFRPDENPQFSAEETSAPQKKTEEQEIPTRQDSPHPQLTNSLGQNGEVVIRLMEQMMVENRRRDELYAQMMERLASSVSARPTEPLNYHIMPDLSKAISDFDGEDDGTKAREWLKN